MLHYQYLFDIKKAQNVPLTLFLYFWRTNTLLYLFIHRLVYQTLTCNSLFRLSRQHTNIGTDIVTHSQCSRLIIRSRFGAHCQTACWFSSSVMAPCSPPPAPQHSGEKLHGLNQFLDHSSETIAIVLYPSIHHCTSIKFCPHLCFCSLEISCPTYCSSPRGINGNT